MTQHPTLTDAERRDRDIRDARRERVYADMCARMPLKAISPWLTTVCTECGDDPTAGMLHSEVRDAMGQDGVWTKQCKGGMTGNEVFDHLLLGRFVLRGCEGYWLINPEVLGFRDRPGWSDWTVDFDEDFG